MKRVFTFVAVFGLLTVMEGYACDSCRTEPKLSPSQPLANESISPPISFPPPDTLSGTGPQVEQGSDAAAPPLDDSGLSIATIDQNSVSDLEPASQMAAPPDADNFAQGEIGSTEGSLAGAPCPKCGGIHKVAVQQNVCPRCGKVHGDSNQQAVCPKCGKVHGRDRNLASSDTQGRCPKCGQIHSVQSSENFPRHANRQLRNRRHVRR